MDVALLRTFVAVVEAGSMADAGPVVGRTASAVSQQLSRLERELGTPLLHRVPSGVRPTQAGLVLLERARHLMGATADVRAAVRAAGEQAERRLRVSSFSSASINLLPTAISQVGRRFPDVELSLVETDYDEPFRDLSAGRVDLTVAFEYDHVPLSAPAGVTVVHIGRDPLRFVAPRDHPLARRRGVSLEQLRDVDWVYFPRGHVVRTSVETETARLGYAPRVRFETQDYQVIHTLVGAGHGIALLPALMTPQYDRSTVVSRPLRASGLGRSILVAHRDGATEPVLAMRDALASVHKSVTT